MTEHQKKAGTGSEKNGMENPGFSGLNYSQGDAEHRRLLPDEELNWLRNNFPNGKENKIFPIFPPGAKKSSMRPGKQLFAIKYCMDDVLLY